MTRSRAIERVRKLQALAAPGSGATGPERDLAGQRADQLMAKHRLLPRDVATAPAPPRPRRTHTPPAPRRNRPPMDYSVNGHPVSYSDFLDFVMRGGQRRAPLPPRMGR